MRRWVVASNRRSVHEQLGRRAFSLNTRKVDCTGKEVSICGWVKNVRKQRKHAFLAITDGQTVKPLQAVISPEQAEKLSTGAAIQVTGRWQSSPGSGQQFELNDVSQVSILGQHDAEHNPIQSKYQTQEYLRTIPHLRGRVTSNAALLRLRSKLIASITDFFDQQGFIQTHTPIVTSSDCEGAGEVFTVSSATEAKDGPQQANKETKVEPFFRLPKYLTVSAQLHLEALSQAVDKVWTLSPTFRAEKSDTPRHLSEFYMLEAEVCFTRSVDDVTQIVENMLRHAAKSLSANGTLEQLQEIRQRAMKEATDEDAKLTTPETLQTRWQGLISPSWPRVKYAEAIQLLQDHVRSGDARFENMPTYDSGFNAEHERYIAEHFGRGSPVFVTDYPRVQKPFYMAPSTATNEGADWGDTVACFDLLVPDLCELAGGSLREHDHEALVVGMADKGVSGENLEWYQDLRKYGSVPHGGFGLGFDRLICYMSGFGNVRDVVAFPRCYESLPPNFSLAANMAAGAFAGIAEHSVMYPIDLLKTRMQVVNPSPTAIYTGVGNALATITRVEGYMSLWRGVGSVVMGAGPAHAVYFATYEFVKQAMGGNASGHHPVAAATSGACATIASDAFMNPFDVIKQRMQVHGSLHRSVFTCARSVLHHEGLRAFYVSYPTTLTMTVPFTALQFTAYESLTKFLQNARNSKKSVDGYDPMTHCIAGGVAGGFAAAATTPLDVIKTLLQTRGTSSDLEIRQARGLFPAAGIIWRREGAKGFFRGMNARVISAAPSTAICWSAYELAKAYFVRENEAS
ncbi:asparaginyl-tRNA synthetase [Polychaeton citri CBS 116435]|uniref:asparagine--tRNA ligase n=1 Tax=Polychaeton citri CBS 116435 TaxID=1314669 RepID=A0A9P4ULJ7_9PEZI|nr:asparaginyl-tRNA synthetase [Polychaeton citri CBS 116435]